MPSSEHTGPDQAETQETYRRAREGLISYMDGRGSYDLTWEIMFVMRTDRGRVVALWTARCAVELHFRGNPTHFFSFFPANAFFQATQKFGDASNKKKTN